ncbi:MAG: PAS domain-containing sensor histidine kinase [Gemmataceae bacterium]
MRWSIRYQLLVPLLALLVGVVACISIWTALTAAERTRAQIETRMRQAARVIDERTFPLSREVLKMTEGLSGADFIVVRGSGEAVTTLDDHLTTAQAGKLHLDGRLIQLPKPTDAPEGLRLGPAISVGGREYFCSGIRVRENRPSEAGIVYILYPVSLWRDSVSEVFWAPLIIGAIGVLYAALLAMALAQRLTRRIQELGQRTSLIAAGDFSPMALPGRNDEIRDLGQSVNDMALKLAQLQDAVRRTERLRLFGQLSGGLAHQLRNGVTGARLAVQLHARECNGHAEPEALDVALRQLALVESNLKRFLDLGRNEEMQKQPCSLSGLIDEAVALLKPQCRHAGIELTWREQEQTELLGDTGQLGHLLLNVIGNAVEAAGPGGRVEIQLRREEGNVYLVDVLDSGPGPAAEVAAKLFEPFVTGKREGVGLGLAVARRVAEAHGGSITWHRQDRRTCFRITLPAGMELEPSESA